MPSPGTVLLLSELWCLLKEEVCYRLGGVAFSRKEFLTQLVGAFLKKKFVTQRVVEPSQGRSVLLS